MNTVSIVAPVIVMLIIGFVCKRTGFVKEEVINGIKKYITGIAIPLLVFNAVATAEYNVRMIVIFGLMLAGMTAALLIGYLTRRFISDKFRKYYPFLITAYEGGMLCYPLYQSLCGESYFTNIVIVDLASCVFVFGVYIGLLQLADRGERFSIKKLAVNAIKTPSFITLIIGIILGTTGLMADFLKTDFANIYLNVQNIIVAPISSMILLCVGYSFSFKRELLKEVFKTVFMRLLVQMFLLIVILLVLRGFQLDKYMLTAFLVYFLSTPTFIVSNYVNDDEANQYIATTTSIYCLITVVGYVIIAAVMF